MTLKENRYEIISCKDNMMQERHRLLQNSLRKEDLGYSIETEYPVVLSPQNKRFSICVLEAETRKLIAHSNFWPRIVFDKKTESKYKIALIGNVATHPSFQKMGIMTNLFNHLEKKAAEEKIEATILWSDLLGFYSKLGFKHFGKETRWVFNKNKFMQNKFPEININIESFKTITEKEIKQLQQLRWPTRLTIQRDIKTWKSVLKIPDLNLISIRRKNRICAFAILGKGADMSGVIHEWGTETDSQIIEIISFIFKKTNLQEIMLLSPANIDNSRLKPLQNYSCEKKTHPMALAKISSSSNLNHISEDAFIWGADSI